MRRVLLTLAVVLLALTPGLNPATGRAQTACPPDAPLPIPVPPGCEPQPEPEQPLPRQICLRLSSDAGTVAPGSIVRYTLALSNGARHNAETVSITLPLPPEQELLEARVNRAGGWVRELSPTALQIALGEVAAGATVTVELRLRTRAAAPAGSVLTQTATVGWSGLPAGVAHRSNRLVQRVGPAAPTLPARLTLQPEGTGLLVISDSFASTELVGLWHDDGARQTPLGTVRADGSGRLAAPIPALSSGMIVAYGQCSGVTAIARPGG